MHTAPLSTYSRVQDQVLLLIQLEEVFLEVVGLGGQLILSNPFQFRRPCMIYYMPNVHITKQEKGHPAAYICCLQKLLIFKFALHICKCNSNLLLSRSRCGWLSPNTTSNLVYRGWFRKFATGLNVIIGIVQKVYEGPGCCFAKMILPWGDRFGQRTAW